MFRDRLEAAERLTDRLADLKTEHPLILAIPRGAVPMGRRMADALNGELDVVLVRKVGAPGNPEYAIGAVDEQGRVALEPAAEYYRGDAVNREVEHQRALIEERRRRYTPVRSAIDPRGRIVVVVDDGSATGATMAAALNALREQSPKRLIAALGAAPPETLARLESLADRVICAESSADFRSVGQFFADFGQVEDDEVIALLGRERG